MVALINGIAGEGGGFGFGLLIAVVGGKNGNAMEVANRVLRYLIARIGQVACRWLRAQFMSKK